MEARTFDVIVVGAGPGGAAAAKRCAELGLSTLLIEKKRLPREKVCSGLLLGRQAQELVEEHFGPLPQEIVVGRLKGLVLHGEGDGHRKVCVDTPITWRKDLDYWMVGRACEKGAELRDVCAARGVESDRTGSRVRVCRAGRVEELSARFVIGADGPHSVVRRCTYPELSVAYSTSTRECYEGKTELEEGYSHVFFPRGRYRPNFWVNPKGGCFTVEGALRELRASVADLLRAWGREDSTPLWKDGCVSRPIPLFEHLVSGRLSAAKGNTLLVGDAASLKIPVSGEGIGTAVKSGLLAADAISKADQTNQRVETTYRLALGELIEKIGKWHARLVDLERNRGTAFLDAVSTEFDATLQHDSF